MFPYSQTYNPAIMEKAKANLDHNALAEETKLGGKFTPTGLDKSIVDAQNNVADMRKAKQIMMLGIGGTLAPTYGYGNGSY
jgi:hypothetical protein